MPKAHSHTKDISAQRLSLDDVQGITGLPRQALLELIELEVLRPGRTRTNEYAFSPADLYRLRKMNRLRRAFDLDCAALGLVMDLLDRVDYMETRLIHLERFARPEDS